MHINIDININIKASEDITNAILTFAALFHNAVPTFNVNPKAIEIKQEIDMKNQEVAVTNEKVETSKSEVK
ncbi:hypothetical protein LGL55_11940 [Clostridium tagluense]|uniref:hypothetical protein n=1 Tax=Clostridium tagluense TaxID=360422 RepID=UPI001CF1039C|nr:hypothetical protein [Clostridium tagluense]MCB2312099.1 hypothetical protein [Clostridium tagluense]MCB2316716.1 hypothetical protein [Clostridium tagluense]MCB2321544.1 hypothetical protein [Clostridium tagluense]MCB2326585.1 hypothetical protein [Clostridium tagluense]MCB2331308.1 hypothetical protein [Clostridium tagluense]